MIIGLLLILVTVLDLLASSCAKLEAAAWLTAQSERRQEEGVIPLGSAHL
jgi:hypothetical protein